MAPRTSVEEVLSRLKAMVHVGELGPGDRLPPERLLCEMFQVSRSTLREGLRALRTEGYIEVRRGSSGGSFISPLNEPYARWLRTMREHPTGCARSSTCARPSSARWPASPLSVGRQPCSSAEAVTAADPATLSAREFRDADAQFHLLLAEASDNPRLKSLVAEARGGSFRARELTAHPSAHHGA